MAAFIQKLNLQPSKRAIIFIATLAAIDAVVWFSIFSSGSGNLELYFLNVGQGDSHLIRLPGGAEILIDGGPHGQVVGELAKALAPTDRYLDLLILTHADADHLNGLLEVVSRYKIGAFIFNGRGSDSKQWSEFVTLLKAKNILTVIAGEGDKIRYGESVLTFLSPGPEFIQSGKPNDAALVALLESKNSKTFFASDIALETENLLLQKYDLDVDILKTAHHGSRFGTSEQFLREAAPKLAVIQVGENRYGHPTEEVLNRLGQIGASIYRNDFDGTIKLLIDGSSIKVFKNI